MIGLLCFALAVLASPFKSRLRLEAENAVLRHQLNVLDAAGVQLETPVGRGRNQRTAAARLVLSRIGRSRGRRILQRKSWSLDTRSADPSSYRRWRSRLLHDLVSSWNIHRNAGGGRRPSVGDRGQL